MKQLSVFFAFLSIGLLASIVLGGDVVKRGNAKAGSGACEDSACPHPPPEPSFRPTSCLDYFRKGKCECGLYTIYDKSGQTFPVYCDMKSERGFAWTLVMSWSTAKRALDAFAKSTFQTNSPVNGNSPNWNWYRQSLAHMQSLKSHSTHWRATCSFPTHGVDYTDYLRGNFKEFDIMTYLGSGQCKKVELINIRGHLGIEKTVRFWQVSNTWNLHTDSYHSGCQFVAKSGSVSSEDNFGYYGVINPKFRCTAGPQATTQWWFGGHL